MLLELSCKIHQGMAIYPGTPEERIAFHSDIRNGDPNNTTTIHHFLPTGTLVDAFFHFDNKGLTIDVLNIEDFVYDNPLVVGVPSAKSQHILLRDLPKTKEIETADILLIRTGYSKYIEEPETLCYDFPALSLEVAEYLRYELPALKAVAVDTMSIEDSHGKEHGFPVHRRLLCNTKEGKRALLVFENVILEEIGERRINRIYAFPLRIVGVEASPIAMVAEMCD